jgi:carboxypeptidase family protein
MAGSRIIAVIVLLGSMVACGSLRPGAGSRAALVTGTVLAGPVSPVSRPGVPATRPVRQATVEALRGSDIVAAARTDAAGRYKLALQPGTYVIRAKAGRYLSRKPAETINISSGETRTVDFVFDTGIR